MRSLCSAAILASAAFAAPPFSVDHNVLRGRAAIVDEFGREVVFRGINVGVEIWANDGRPSDPAEYADGKCPSAASSVNQPPVCGVDAGKGKWNQSTTFDSKNDFAQMRALGFNLVRLAMSWSLLEPEPFQYSRAYLDRIRQVVDWAAEQDIPVVLDMHQDSYSPTIHGGSDGAPAWACLNVSYPWAVDWVWPKIAGFVPDAYGKEVLTAFDAFYMNEQVESTGKGLQEHFLLAWAEVMKRFDGNPNVIGYEILNEPLPGIAAVLKPLHGTPVLGFSTDYLYPIYTRFIQAMTGVRDGLPDCSADQPIADGCAYPDLGIHTEKLVLFEPMALRNQLDISLQISKKFTDYPNIVFAPHTYSHFFTVPHWPPTYRLSLDSAWTEARLMGASVLATEFGGGGGSAEDLEKVGNITRQFDDHFGTSGTMWTWKENGDWGMCESKATSDEPNGPFRPGRVQIHSRTYARAVAGNVLEHVYDHLTGAFRLRALAGLGWKDQGTEIYVPPHLSGEVSVAGTASLRQVLEQPDGSRIAFVSPWLSGGAYQVEVGGSPKAKPEVEYRHPSDETLGALAQAIAPQRQDGRLSEVSLAELLNRAASEMYPESAVV